jgi:hypothetical protein
MVVVGTYGNARETSVSSHRRCHADPHRGGPQTVHVKENIVLILLPLLRRLSARSQMAVGLALTTVGLFLIIAAIAHGVIAVIVGAIFLVSACRGRLRARLPYPSR